MNPPPSFDPALVVPVVQWPLSLASADEGTPMGAPLAGDAAGSVLRQVAAPWTPADGDIAPLLARLRATLLHTGGVGIAAPQIGVSRRVFLVKHGTRPLAQGPGEKPPSIVAYINPQVVWVSPEQLEDYEACLSVGGVGGQLPRALHVRVRYQAADDLYGPARQVEASDWDARIFQHELDHIDGRLYIDHVAEKSRELLPIDEMRRRRDAGHRQRGLLP